MVTEPSDDRNGTATLIKDARHLKSASRIRIRNPRWPTFPAVPPSRPILPADRWLGRRAASSANPKPTTKSLAEVTCPAMIRSAAQNVCTQPHPAQEGSKEDRRVAKRTPAYPNVSRQALPPAEGQVDVAHRPLTPQVTPTAAVTS